MTAHRPPSPRALAPRQFPVLGPLLFHAYGLPSWRLKQFIRWLLYRLERGSVFSVTLRRIFLRYHGVTVGDYTHGGWIRPFQIDDGTRIGRYASIAETARVLTHNHPLTTKSTSGLFFNPFFGLVPESKAEHGTIEIGNDVWIGHNAVVLPAVRSIGDGAVIGAGAVVGRDVPPYAIVHGNPARVVGYRFSPERIAELLAERWWDRPLAELVGDLGVFTRPLDDEGAR